MIYEHQIELFDVEEIPTEATAFRLLREKPVEGVPFYATPWCVHINKKSLRQGVARTRLLGGFAICQHIRYREIIPHLRRLGITVLFTPHAVKHWRFTVLPFPHYAVCSSDPRPKELLYSFVGFNSHRCRQPLLRLPQRSDVVIESRERWHFDVDAATRAAAQQQYIDVLAVSRFSLCPRGTGPSTVRFWESLRAGAIPVVIADKMQLPAGFDWDACTLRLPERKAHQVDELIRSISPGREEAMRDACLEAFRAFSGENFVSPVRRYYAQAAAQAA